PCARLLAAATQHVPKGREAFGSLHRGRRAPEPLRPRGSRARALWRAPAPASPLFPRGRGPAPPPPGRPGEARGQRAQVPRLEAGDPALKTPGPPPPALPGARGGFPPPG